MRYGSICSGIEAASVAWHPLGWRAAFFSEIEAFPRAVLKHRWPGVPLHGDFTTIGADEYGPIDLLVGGTPCQSFSVAGLRGGLADDRGNLALEFLRLADRTRPRWLVWENVPGVLSSNGGRDFGAILGGMVELGYGFAYRVLDAQFFGIPQRRRRVFVVGHLGEWRRAAAVLFERHSLQGHPAPSREKGQGVAPTISARPTGGGGLGTDFDCDGGLIAFAADDYQSGSFTRVGQAAPLTTSADRTRAAPVVAFAENSRAELRLEGGDGQVASSLKGGGGKPGQSYPVVAFQPRIGRNGRGYAEATMPALNGADAGATSDMRPGIASASAVRRLTPRECERLQGFPDDWTLIPWRGGLAPDGPRYKALGNSFAVPVVRWIGERIEAVDALATLPRLEQAAE